MSIPEGFVELRETRGIGWVREDLADLGLPMFWAAVTALPGAKGRGGVGQLELKPGIVAVVRPFRRGGAFARLLGERYGGSARVFDELSVLAHLKREGVPVATPLAAVARRHHAFWRLRILTRIEPGALGLPSFCAAYPRLRSWAIEAAGVCVQLAVRSGLWHPDLHPDNLLLAPRGDRVRAVLVDLDKAKLKPSISDGDRAKMLVRMARYLHRHADALPVVPTRADYLRFLKAFGLDRKSRRECFLALGPELAKSLARHGLLRGRAPGKPRASKRTPREPNP
ncbi:MAG: hypothetical protein Fur0037_06070 [Planctomycetota bacterium]